MAPFGKKNNSLSSNLLPSYLEHDSDDVLPLLVRDVDDEPRAQVVQDRQGNRVRSHGRGPIVDTVAREYYSNYECDLKIAKW